jgi:hypothetical protein
MRVSPQRLLAAARRRATSPSKSAGSSSGTSNPWSWATSQGRSFRTSGFPILRIPWLPSTRSPT